MTLIGTAMINHRLFCFSQNLEPSTRLFENPEPSTRNRSSRKLVAESGFLSPYLFIQSEIPLFSAGKPPNLDCKSGYLKVELVAESGFLSPHLFIQSEIPLFSSGKTTEP